MSPFLPRVILSLGLLLSPGLVYGQEGYSFFLGRKRVFPELFELHGLPGRPGPGDLVLLEGFFFRLGTPGKYFLSIEPIPAGRLWLEKGPGRGKRALLAIKAGVFHKKSGPVLVEGWKGLPTGVIEGVQGLTLGGWCKEITAALKKIDPGTCCVSLDRLGGVPPFSGDRSPDLVSLLSRGIRNLAFFTYSGGPPNGLKDLHRLEFFLFRAFSRHSSFDLGLIRGAEGLRFLEIGGFRLDLKNGPVLSSLPRLEVLRLKGCRGTGLFGESGDWKKLKVLSLRDCIFPDFPFPKKAPNLEILQVIGCPVPGIPLADCGKLRKLLLVGTEVKPEEVARFRKAHPSCRVVATLEGAFRERAEEADRIVLARHGGALLKVLEGKNEVKRLLSMLAIEERRTEGRYGCAPELEIRFFHGDDLRITLLAVNAFNNRGLFKGKVLVRCDSIWPNETFLSRKSSRRFYQWMDRVLEEK